MINNFANKIIAHRGVPTPLWPDNSLGGIENSLLFGFGIETDVRDGNAKILISHDPVTMQRKSLESEPFGLEELINKLRKNSNARGPVALNVKSDGLLSLGLAKIVDGLDDFFFFDLPIPELAAYGRSGLPIAFRASEHEPLDVIQRESHLNADYVWLDSFYSDWFLEEKHWFDVARIMDSKKIILVSPEFHGRDPNPTYERFLSEAENPNLYICVDNPEGLVREYGHGN